MSESTITNVPPEDQAGEEAHDVQVGPGKTADSSLITDPTVTEPELATGSPASVAGQLEDTGFGVSSEFGAEAVIAQWREERETRPAETDEDSDEVVETMDEWKARTGFDLDQARAERALEDEQAALDSRKAEIEELKSRRAENAPPAAERPETTAGAAAEPPSQAQVEAETAPQQPAAAQ